MFRKKALKSFLYILHLEKSIEAKLIVNAFLLSIIGALIAGLLKEVWYN